MAQKDGQAWGCIIPLVGTIVIVVIALLAQAAKAEKGNTFCEIVGSETPISEGMDIAEYDALQKQWRGVPSDTFENKPYLILRGPENGYYAVFKGIGGGVIVVPFDSLSDGTDGFQHDTCGYLITWDP